MRILAFVLASCLGAVAALAQPPSPSAPQDPLGQQLFAPELVLGNQQEIDLTPAQLEAIKTAIKQSQPEFVDLQVKLQMEAGKLVTLMSPARVDEKSALAQAGKVMSLESQLKSTQLAFLIRIKNALTAEQQAKLRAKRGAAH